MKTDRKNIIWVLLTVLVFILIDGYFIAHKNLYFNLVPFVLIVILFTIFSLDKTILLITFFVPISIPLRTFYPDLGIDMYLPTEPLMVGVLILFLLKILKERTFDKKVLIHPVSITIYFSLFWILITSFTSTMPIVSLKFFLSRIWFLVSFYFLATQLFKNPKNFKLFLALYFVAFLIAIGYTLKNHLSYGLFDQEAANFVCSPLYNDHTAYGAALAIAIFGILGIIFDNKIKGIWRIISLVIFGIFIFAIIFSYSRAAWLSVFVAVVVLILILFKIKFKIVAFLSLILIVVGSLIYNQLMNDLEKNRQDSSSDFAEQLQSMTNISTDASNVERLNRWSCAVRMFEKKPIFGWGPGTYMFQYAPFQLSYEKTIISTNEGDRGNAHSEYLGPLAESGVLGMVYMLLIAVFAMITGLRAYKYAVNKEIKILTLFTLLGLVTYLVHGFLNNFLDSDKLSALFWGSIAFLVVADIYFTKKPDKQIEE
ncbi:MAG: hypothetical protein DRP35_10035 [Candidatus Zixiibacteriota bacterium]|nr:MAG: hypothetical protein DRP35_10035 [candidate division Zixibacteria bacterium]